MSRRPKNPLRPLLEEERQQLMRLSRGQALAASPVARAKAVLAVADGSNYTDAAPGLFNARVLDRPIAGRS